MSNRSGMTQHTNRRSGACRNNGRTSGDLLNPPIFNFTRQNIMRIRPLEPDAFDTSLAPVLEDILRLRGAVYNLHRVLAHSPKALRAFMTFSAYVRDEADLSARLREL